MPFAGVHSVSSTGAASDDIWEILLASIVCRKCLPYLVEAQVESQRCGSERAGKVNVARAISDKRGYVLVSHIIVVTTIFKMILCLQNKSEALL